MQRFRPAVRVVLTRVLGFPVVYSRYGGFFGSRVGVCIFKRLFVVSVVSEGSVRLVLVGFIFSCCFSILMEGVDDIYA